MITLYTYLEVVTLSKDNPFSVSCKDEGFFATILAGLNYFCNPGMLEQRVGFQVCNRDPSYGSNQGTNSTVVCSFAAMGAKHG